MEEQHPSTHTIRKWIESAMYWKRVTTERLMDMRKAVFSHMHERKRTFPLQRADRSFDMETNKQASPAIPARFGGKEQLYASN